MSCTLLQTGHEGEDQGSDEICRPPHALPASALIRRALPGGEITHALTPKLVKPLYSTPPNTLETK